MVKIAEKGNQDKDYVYMKDFIWKKQHITYVDKESDLHQIQGEYQSLSLHETQEGELILKNASEILIPRNYRPELKDLLHSTHLSDGGMISLAKSKFFWPSIKSDLKEYYKACEQCLLNPPSKPSPPHEVVPDSLELVSLNEIVHLD